MFPGDNLEVITIADIRVYTLNGLPPEVVAVAFAKSSRSPEAFDKIAKELTDESSSRFHEKWVVGYGHSSVAEHAVLSMAMENVSMLATKVIEDNRLASYTEKSTRYQVFDKTKYHKPRNLMSSDLGKIYEETADHIFDKYQELIDRIIPFLEKKYPKGETPDKLYEIQIKNRALDNIRYMLPISTQTNLGMTANARCLEHAAIKLLSHPLLEMQDIGKAIKEAAVRVTPTLIKYVEQNEYIMGTQRSLNETKIDLPKVEPVDQNIITLEEYDEDAVEKVIAGIIYRSCHNSYKEIKDYVKKMSEGDKVAILDKVFENLRKFDTPIRELEHTFYTFDILMDYGAFRDIQRHRMVTQTNQDMTIAHGFSIPPEVVEAGLEDDYMKVMVKAAQTYQLIHKKFPDEAAYIIPMGYRKRLLFKCNLREAYHFIRLRSGKMGHTSYRRIAQQMYDLRKEKHPLLGKYLVVDKEGY